MVATVLLWKPSGKASCTMAMIQVGERGHSDLSATLQSPAPVPGFPKDPETQSVCR